MDLFNLVLNIFEIIFYAINTPLFMICVIIFVVIYHIILLLLRDLKYFKNLKRFDDPKTIKLEDLNNPPLINIIIPAWKEGQIFKGCLESIKQLIYPNLRIIVCAGGSEETVNIANSFKQYGNFKILNQEKGGGKIKAINDCLAHISEGIICQIDADVYLADDTILQMLNPLLYHDEVIAISELKPHKSQVQKNLVRYLYINRNTRYRLPFTRYHTNAISQCSFLKYNVYKTIGKYTEKRLMEDGLSMGKDLIENGYKVYLFKSKIAVSFNYPDHLKDYFNQNIRWLQNAYIIRYKTSKKAIFKFLGLILISLYLLLFPFLFFIDFGLFFIGIIILLFRYLKFIRKIIFFNKTSNKEFFGKNRLSFFFICIFYIYIEALMNIYLFLELIFIGNKKFKERKNIETSNSA